MSAYLIPSLVILVLVVANGFFVAAEFALIASRKPQLTRLSESGSTSATGMLEIISQPVRQDRYIAATQLGITLASVGLGMYGEEALAHWFLGPLEHWGVLGEALAHTLATVFAVVVMTYFHVVIGEMIPKAVALQHPEPTALRVLLPMRVFSLLFRPFVWFLNLVGHSLLRLLRVPVASHGRHYSVSDLEQLVDESYEGGTVAERQHEIIDNIFGFAERTVAQLMTPRTRVIGLEISSSEADILRLLETEGFSRMPVYETDLDHIVGVLHVKDFIRAQALQPGPFNVRAYLRRAPRIPETMSAEALLEAFKRLKVHIAVVLNEYGGTAGIITLEDLIEEVVGDVQDEFDEETPEVRELEPGVLLVKGETLIDDLNHDYDLNLASGTSDTLGGLIVDELGRRPEAGDHIELAEVSLTIEAVKGLAVEEVKMVLPTPAESSEEPAET